MKKFSLWLLSYGWAVVLMIGASFAKRRRMSHNNGVTAVGRVKVVAEPKFPAHEFFKPGREWPCRLRHASVSYQDDTVTQVRSASIKFADSDWESPLDLEMNTGLTSLFWSAHNFIEFFRMDGREHDCDFVPFYKKYPQGLRAAREGVRRYPATFTQLYFHSQCAQHFIGVDGVLRYVKFRLIPEDRGAETGLMTAAEMDQPYWPERVEPGETRSPNYLKRDLADRVARGPVRYHLQLQLHTPSAADTEEIFNCNVAWDDATHPWFDLADVTLEKTLSLDEGNLMRYSVSHAPASLAIPPSDSSTDYNSVLYMRSKSKLAKSSRIVAYKIFGMPKPFPEDRVNAPEH